MAQRRNRGRAGLKRALDALYEGYDFRARLRHDPLMFPRRYRRRADREVVAFIAASLAYGRVGLFMPVIQAVLEAMGSHPGQYLEHFDLRAAKKSLKGISYRFQSDRDLVALLYVLSRAIKKFGSLESAFMLNYSEHDADVGPALKGFMRLLRDVDVSAVYGRGASPAGLWQMLPSPHGGSACKRLNLFMRWVVRRADIDLGIWKGVSPGSLVIPLDTHIARVSRCLGLTQRRSSGWATAVEITRSLSALDALDPLKYDFALCHRGISGVCSREGCANCELDGFLKNTTEIRPHMKFDSLKVEQSSEPEDLFCYGFDASGRKELPALVAWPTSTEDVVRIMKYSDEHGMVVVPRGAGSGMTAGSVPTRGAIILSTEKLNRVLEVDPDNFNAVLEPGLINAEFQAELAGRGFFYPPDPASMAFCTLGGNVAENAGGPRALKYGVTRDYVMGLEAVLPGGEVINTGVRTHKGVVGYDLTRLLVGSEGTLAVLTKIRLKFMSEPEAVTTLLAFFGDLESCGRAVSEIIASGIVPRTLEFMDREAVRAVEAYKPAGLSTVPDAMLLIELDGYPETIEREAERVVQICHGLRAKVEAAEDREARDRLWSARRAVSPALYNLSPGKINEDVVVPRSRVPEMLVTLREISERSGISIVNFGHAGDGNIHVNIMADKDDPDEFKRAEGLVKEIFSSVLAMGGTISGEHGVGLTKAKYINMEIRERELELMRGIKRLFDPRGLLNPGKIFQ